MVYITNLNYLGVSEKGAYLQMANTSTGGNLRHNL